MTEEELELELIESVASFEHDPKGYANFAYDWGVGELQLADGPRKWQSELLGDIGDHLGNEKTRHQPLMIAVASGHGIGKSSVVGMVIDWALSTCEDTRVVVTANTDTQLKTKTVPEVTKWLRRSITSHWFKHTATRITSIDSDHETSWKCDFTPWSEHNTEAFAGLHNERKRIVLIFDEASAIADNVWEVAEGALTDENTEIIWLCFGNPTRVSGRFRECFRKYRHRWIHKQIDSRTVEGINLVQIRKWEDDYGADSDFFKVRVRGQFPKSGDKQFISTELADASRERGAERFTYNMNMPLSIGIDFARSGDDSSVIRARRGRHVYPSIRFKERNSMKAAAIVMDKITQARQLWGSAPDGIFADGGSIGGPIIDRMKQLGCEDVIEVMFGSSAEDKDQWGNKRIEMWASMRDWLEVGCIDDNQQLYDDLIAPEMLIMKNRDQFILESKEDMKKRGIPSTDEGDALALTFAYPVSKKKPEIEPIVNYTVIDAVAGY